MGKFLINIFKSNKIHIREIDNVSCNNSSLQTNSRNKGFKRLDHFSWDKNYI